jgi:alpha-galactosidase
MATDEWTFRIRFLSPVDGQQLIELRQARPSKENDHPGSYSTSNDDERASLLLQNSATVSSTGWMLTSPFWSIQSSILLSVTYFPAWQGLPEYTTQNSGCSSCCCCHVEGCCGMKKDFFTEYFTVEDVVKVQIVEAHQIRGVGICRAVKLHLRPLLYDAASYPIPPQFQSAWESHLEHMEHNQSELSYQQSNDSIDGNMGPILTFCLSSTQMDPPLLWKVEIPALKTAIAMETITVFEGKLQAAGSGFFPTHTYVNGFQSWTFSGSIPRGAPQPKSAMPDRVSHAFNAGGASPPTDATLLASSPQPYVPNDDFPSTYTSDFFTCISSDGGTTEQLYPPLDETGGPACVMGWLSQRQQFGIITADSNLERLQMHASCQGQVLLPNRRIVTDWAYVQLTTPHSYDEEPMVYFLHAVAAYNEARPMANLLTGWCSWYVFYQNISETILRENFVTLKEMRTHVPTNVAVVDDGYMTAWGDWDSCKAGQFPSSLGVVADDIRKNQMRPGLWLAPFAADKHSVLTKEHPDWIIRNNGGFPANSSNCGKFFYGLDATNPAVRRHVHGAIERAVKQWGYSVLKIDFLYAACLEGNGRYDLSMSRAQAMHVALQTIREAAGSTAFLIGCGCPIASGIGMVDAMRVSADTGPAW